MLALAVPLSVLTTAPAWAAEPSSQLAPIVIGQSCDLSGPTSSRTKEYVKGVDAYLAHVNATGGVHGHPIKLVRRDDGFSPDKGLENARRLYDEDKILAYFAMGSAPVTAAVMPYAQAKGVPVLGSMSGADSLRKQQPLLFHIRASFGEEIERLAAYLATLGVGRIGAIAADAPIGHDGVAALKEAALRHKLEIVGIAQVQADMANLDEAASQIARAAPPAVLVLAPAGPAIKFVEALKKHQVHAQLLGISVMSSQALYKALGAQVEGMLLTQTVPFPWNSRLGIVRDYQKRMAEANIPVSFDTMDGYVSARLLIEALKAAGPNPSRKAFVSALESMQNRDLDGLHVSYSRNTRSLIRLVDISMIGRDKRLVN